MFNRTISARFKQNRVALLAELITSLLTSDPVNHGLNAALRHARVEHVHVRSQIRLPR